MSDPAAPHDDTLTPPAEVATGVPPAAPADDTPAPGGTPAPRDATPATEAEAEAGVDGAPADATTTTNATDAITATPAPGMSPAACGAKLGELFPALFGTGGPPKPIKLRIHVDLQARVPGVFSRRVLGPFFARYTTSNAYLKALSTATQRFDLDGQPAGEVTEEHRAAALAELARRREIAIARRAAERGAQRPPARARADNTAAGPGGGAAAATADATTVGPAGDGRRPPRGPRRDGPRHAGQRDGPHRARQRDATRGAQGEGQRQHGEGQRQDRPPHPARPPRARQDDRPPRSGAPGPRPGDARPARPERAADAPEPLDPAQRDRALLLRQFESSPLTKANFCVLKRIAEAELDAQLDLARRERAERDKR